METANPILGNPLLIVAILLFLAVLPRALRQKEKTALDKAVERFEKEESKAAVKKNPEQEKNTDQSDSKHETPASPKDRTLDYLKDEMLDSLKTTDHGSIPPFQRNETKRGTVKIVKEGVPISHNEATDLPPAPKKKIKLIKREISISPSENRASSKKAPSIAPKGKNSTPPGKDQKSTGDGDFLPPSINDFTNEASDDNWIEAEIPGLIIEAPPEEKSSEKIPTFKASPKAKHQSEAEKSQKSPKKEKSGVKVKNIAPMSEEKQDPTLKKADSPELDIEISESKPKAVEKKAPVASHKNIAKNEVEPEKSKAPSSKTKETQKAEVEARAVPHQQEDINTSPEKAEPKPFLLDLKYLDRDEMETENTVSQEKIPGDLADMMIARLTDLQNNLEKQLVTIPGELTAGENPINGNTRKDSIQNSHPDSKETTDESSGFKEISLEKLDSFLFTATQRTNRE